LHYLVQRSHYVIELKPTNVWRLQNLNQPESKAAKLSGYRTLKAHVSDNRIKATEVLGSVTWYFGLF
jgi:hypothetical protein